MKRIEFIEQMEKKECGIACLTMMFNYLGFNISLNELRQEFPAPKTGISFHNIVEICKYYNFEADPYKVSKGNIEKLTSKSIPLPAIIQWDKGTHFVILEKISKSYVEIVDPSLGPLRVDREDFLRLFSGNLIYINRTVNVLPTLKNKKNRFVFEAFKPSIKLLSMIFLISAALQLFNTLPALMLGKMIDKVATENIASNNYLVFAIIGVGIFSFASQFLRSRILILVQNKIDFSIMTKYFSHFLRLPISFYENRQQGDLIYRVNLLTRIREIISTHFLGILLDFSLIIVYVFIMFSISTELSLLMIMFGCVVILLLMFFTPISYKLSKRVLLKQTEMQEYMAETINNIYDIKLYASEEKVYSEWEKIFLKYLNVLKQNNTLSLGVDSFLSSFQLMQNVIIFFIGSYFVVNNQITIGTLLSFVFISSSFITPIFSLCSSYLSLTQILSIFQRIQDVFDSESEQYTGLDKVLVSQLKGKIEFRNVSFSFNKFDPLILDKVSFTINPGETVWLQGDSGSGKSTILKLILGIYKPLEGLILIDDIPIDEYDIYSLRNSIASVLQESRLFNKSIAENITLDDESYDAVKLYEAIYDTNLEPVINALKTKEKTIICENGANFSGGQKQKLLIARALYKKANLLMIDEATNSLDKENENFIMERIALKDITKIIITHDNNTLKSYDKRLVLSNKNVKVDTNRTHIVDNKNEVVI